MTTTDISVYAIPGIRGEETKDDQDMIEVVDRIIQDVFGIDILSLRVKTRKREIVYPRQMHMALTQLAGLSLRESALPFNKDHATVVHAKKIVSNRIDTKYPKKDYYDAIKSIEILKSKVRNINMSRLQGNRDY